MLRRSGKPVLYAVNKIDGPGQEEAVYEFYQLGVERVFPISALLGALPHQIADLAGDLAPGDDRGGTPGDLALPGPVRVDGDRLTGRVHRSGRAHGLSVAPPPAP